MKPALAAVFAAALLLAACDRPQQPRTEPSAGSVPSLPTQPRPQTDAPSDKASPPSAQTQPRQE